MLDRWISMYKHRKAEILRPVKERRPQDDKVGGRTENVTTATAGNLAGHPEKGKDKVEKRRALGRGLESLLPGPRVVRPAAVPVPTGYADGGTRAGAPAPHGALPVPFWQGTLERLLSYLW